MWGLPGGSVVKNLLANAGDMGSVLTSGRSPREGNGNLLQNSCQGNPMDREAWLATVLGVAKELDTTQQLIPHTCIFKSDFKHIILECIASICRIIKKKLYRKLNQSIISLQVRKEKHITVTNRIQARMHAK